MLACVQDRGGETSLTVLRAVLECARVFWLRQGVACVCVHACAGVVYDFVVISCLHVFVHVFVSVFASLVCVLCVRRSLHWLVRNEVVGGFLFAWNH